jgi:peroxiredoxin
VVSSQWYRFSLHCQLLATSYRYQLLTTEVSVNRNWLVIGVLAIALAVMVGFGFRNAHKSAGTRASFGVASVRGQQAPDFELQDVSTGKTVKLSDYRGKAVLLNFWATWCPPCKIEIPWFVDLQKQYANDGLVVLGVAMDDASQQEIAKFSKDMGITYSVLLGTEKVGDAYGGVEALPTTFYIGRDGKVTDRVFGLPPGGHAAAEDKVKAALNTSAGTQAASADQAKDVSANTAATPASGDTRR